MESVDWATAKGIANEPTLDRFVKKLGGQKISEIIPCANFENADYLFRQQNVIIELKTLESEFGDTNEFKSKLSVLIDKFAREGKLGGGPFFGKPYSQEFVSAFIDLFRPPLARIAKKANRQIRQSKIQLNLPDARGVLLCVNDEFRGLEPRFIKGLFGRILNGSCSSIDGVIYHTNHYVGISPSEYAHLLWTTMYAEGPPDWLVEFVYNLGGKWFDFCEAEGLPADERLEGPHLSIDNARAIKKQK